MKVVRLYLDRSDIQPNSYYASFRVTMLWLWWVDRAKFYNYMVLAMIGDIGYRVRGDWLFEFKRT